MNIPLPSFSPVPMVTLEAIYRNDKVCGYIRRTAYGYSVGCNEAWGYVENEAGVTLDWLRAGTYKVRVIRKYWSLIG